MRHFESDGCSGGFSKTWQWLFKQKSPFYRACVTHDIAYFDGAGKDATFRENFVARLTADNQFFRDVRDACPAGYVFAPVMWLAVRLGGGAYWKRSYSWGFGLR